MIFHCGKGNWHLEYDSESQGTSSGFYVTVHLTEVELRCGYWYLVVPRFISRMLSRKHRIRAQEFTREMEGVKWVRD